MFLRRTWFLTLASSFLIALALDGQTISNWSAPAAWSPTRSHGLATQGDISSPLPFIAVTPCRQYDSRNATALPHNTAREVVITGAPCGLPTSAAAVSLNVTVFDILGQTGNAVFQVGTTSNPTTAWINYPIGQGQIGNAGVLPLSGASSIFFRVQQGGGSIDFTIDVNGYYASTPASSSNYFSVVNSGLNAIYGQTSSTASGSSAVFGNAQASTGLISGVWGQTNSTTSFARGILGFASATSGEATYGVLGVTLSAAYGAAGVFGFDGTGLVAAGTSLSAGVHGESQTHVGVLGRSTLAGALGVLYSTAGVALGEGLLGTTFGTAPDMTTGPWAVFAMGNLGAFGTKHFVEPHPEDPNKVILYSSIEGRTVDTYFRGTARFVNREAIIEVPEDFRIVTAEEGLTVQITPIGGFASAYVESRDLNRIVVRSSKDIEFDYLVQGVRRAYKDFQPVQKGHEFMPRSPSEKLPAYLTEEAKRRLIANGTYNADGTVNLDTAQRAGWTKIWADRQAETEAAVAREAQRRATSLK